MIVLMNIALIIPNCLDCEVLECNCNRTANSHIDYVKNPDLPQELSIKVNYTGGK